MENQVEFKVSGKYALFTDPLTNLGGEKFSYSVPTYSALVGICESIYWKPTFKWIVDEVRVMNRMSRKNYATRPVNYFDDSTPIVSYYTYLTDVEYRVKAHFEWDYDQEKLADDRIDGKHYEIAKRMIEQGGRRKIFLGKSECVGYVEPADFDEGEGYYDHSGVIDLGMMLHGITYPTKNNSNRLVRMWDAVMDNGVIRFPRPEECRIVRPAGKGVWKEFQSSQEKTGGEK